MKLKPCPFCGGAADFDRLGTTRASTIYRCTECGCGLETGETFGHGLSWNARPEETRLSTALAAAEQAKEAFKGSWAEQLKLSKMYFDQLQSEQAKCAVLGDALRPFADKAEKMPVATSDERKYTLIEVEHCRAAKSALSTLPASASAMVEELKLARDVVKAAKEVRELVETERRRFKKTGQQVYAWFLTAQGKITDPWSGLVRALTALNPPLREKETNK